MPASTPKVPTLVMVKVPPDMAAGWVFPSRAVVTISLSAVARSSRLSAWAFFTFGTTNPRGVAAAIPRLTALFSTMCWVASCHEEFSCGTRPNARQTALETISNGEIRTPRNSRRSLSRATSSTVSDTSQVTHSVTCGAVNAELTIAAAVALRTPLIGIRVCPSSPGSDSAPSSPTPPVP